MNFNTMVHKYSITPMMEHYTCMVDLLARAGHLTEAYNFVERMPIKPEARLLTALFSSCCSHMNVELAKTVRQRLIELEPEEAGAYMLLSNFYGIIGDLEGVANVRKLMSKRGIRKTKACTRIEIDRKVHSFESGDGSHPLNKEIYNYLKDLVKKMKNIGYVPNTSMVMQNVDDHTKEEMVLSHSEKLAITLGLIITPPGTRIMIVKNLRTAIYLLHWFQRLKEGRLSREILANFIISIMDHALVEIIGWMNFNTMVHKYSITPMMEHYTCMVDLLARAGHLTEAYNFVERMPIKPEARLLTALFSSCCSHMNVELAKTVGQRLIELEPEEAGAYMLLSNFYGIIGDLEAVANVRKLMSKRGIRKTKACTWIEIDRKVHSFESGDGSHPLNKEIYSYLKDLVKKMKNIGYVPNTSMVMQNVDDHTKEEMVLSHSEKLAITLGLIITPLGTRIMIVKNLKVYVQTAIYLLHLFQRLKEGRLSREILADFIISIMDHALVEIIGRGMGGSLP
ncbi:putative pentatricopeptide repeat-containing protein [Quercus suber]|uniref:Pentatricopeptide repeat-containing protein n=2 Tax=Quercus suber TaxID=58331 RepID=A0AAW0LKD1_QUESU